MVNLEARLYRVLMLLPGRARVNPTLTLTLAGLPGWAPPDDDGVEAWATSVARALSAPGAPDLPWLVDALVRDFPGENLAMAELRTVAEDHGLPWPLATPRDPRDEPAPETRPVAIHLTLTFSRDHLVATRSDRPAQARPSWALPPELPPELVTAVDGFQAQQAARIAQVRHQGTLLGNALRAALAGLPGDPGGAWAVVRDCLQDVRPERGNLALRLEFAQPESPWAFLPWELLTLDQGNAFLIELPYVDVYRRLATDYPGRARVPGGTDHLLLVGGPDGGDPEPDTTRKMMAAAAGRFVAAGRCAGREVVHRTEPTAEAAVDLVRECEPRVLSLLGHGLGEVFTLAPGAPLQVRALAEAMPAPRVPEAVLLGACHSGTGNAATTTTWHAAVAPFLGRGVPEVLGFSQAVSLRDASVATAVWSGALAQGAHPFAATRAARGVLLGYDSLGACLLTHWRGPATEGDLPS